MKLYKNAIVLLLPFVAFTLPAEAQLPGAARRATRQLQRQINRTGYYTDRAWQQVNPWVQEYGVAPLRRAANAVGQTVDAATRIGDGQFGYRDQSAPNSWFYDYYTYSPTYYATPADERYSTAIRYFDPDGDGVFDSRSRYRDSDNDGRYDEYDRYDFYSAQAGVRSSDRAEADNSLDDDANRYIGPQDARRHTVNGKISVTKVADVNGNQNLVIGIDDGNNQTQAIDLGPVDQMRGAGVEVGASIVAAGVMETVGDKPLLMADRVRINDGKSMEVDRRRGEQLTGQSVSVKNTQIDSTDHYLAVVEIDGERQLVDLGPTSNFKQQIEPSTTVTLVGIPVRVDNYRVLMANRVKLGDQTITIDRL
jgi:hypothetical protein